MQTLKFQRPVPALHPVRLTVLLSLSPPGDVVGCGMSAAVRLPRSLIGADREKVQDVR
jgi:hypothetical protein